MMMSRTSDDGVRRAAVLALAELKSLAGRLAERLDGEGPAPPPTVAALLLLAARQHGELLKAGRPLGPGVKGAS
jgi:hypothetical protein